MAKFTSTAPLDLRYFGNEISGAAGATHRIPDSLYEEFNAAYADLIPGLTWITQDETTSLVTGAIVAASISASGGASVGGVVVNGGGFSNSLDSDVWVAGAQQSNPTNSTQGIYVQHRVAGNAGSYVHDAVAAEIRLAAINSSRFLNAFEASVVVSSGSNTIPDTRAITANVTLDAGVTGSVTQSRVIAAQTVVNSSSATIGTVYGIHADRQTAGTTNYNIYAPTGSTHLGIVETEGDLVVGVDGTGARKISLSGASSTARDFKFQTGGVDRFILRVNTTAETGSNAGSDLEIMARTDAGAANVIPVRITRSTGAVGIGDVPIGFYGVTPATRQIVTGSRSTGDALTSLLTALSTIGIITDSTSA